MDPRHAILFEPVRIGPVTLPNRFYQVPHASGFGSARPRAQAAFRAIKAEGGWGGVCVEYAAISPDSDETPECSADFWDDDHAAALALTAEAIGRHGALAGIELFHGGAASINGSSRLPRLAPSQVSSELHHGGLALEMSMDDIRRVQRDWVTAARRARDAGFAIVYVYGAHGYLLTQFFSARTNTRTDGYGGSLLNRGRFWLETLEAVRTAVGADCAIATRISVQGKAAVPGPGGLAGIEADEMLTLIAAASDLADLFDVTVGTWPEDSGTSRYYPEGHQQPWTHRVREATSKPIVAVGRYSSPDLMARVIESGAVDLIGSARQAIADPFLPRKVAEGRADEIRECTGSNVCILREESFHHVGCVQKATAGEEYRRGWHPEMFTLAANRTAPALIIGAGPAGLECAVVLGRRGFDSVHLVDAAPQAGGQLAQIRRLPTLGDWGRILDYRTVQLARLGGVEVITGRELTAGDVLEYGARLVVVATGSAWRADGVQPGRADPMPGAELGPPFVLTPGLVLAGHRPAGRRVLVYDADGYFMAPAIAELLAGLGHQVTIVATSAELSPVSDETLEGEALRAHVHRAGIAVAYGTTVTRLDWAVEAARQAPGQANGSAHGEDRHGEPWSMPCDGVVLVTQRQSRDQLYRDLTADPAGLAAAGIDAVYRIGDAVAPRMLSEAIFDGHRLAREIDRPDPGTPAPYLREPARLRPG